MKKSFRLLLFLLFSILMLAPVANAGDKKERDDITARVRKYLPELAGSNNVGTDFWISNPPCFEDESNTNFVKVYITSAVKTLIRLEIPGKGYYKAQMSVPNDVIVFDLTPTLGQPVEKKGRQDCIPEQIYQGYGIHLWADDPMVVYSVVRFIYTSDGYLAIPVSGLGKEYIAAAYNEDPMFRAVWGYKLPSELCIVAPFDKTRVRFTMGGGLTSITAGGLKPGQSAEQRMNKGDVWMFMSNADGADLTGSKIVGSKPIACVTANQCTNIPVGNQWCDYTCEMLLPTNTWGKDYHVAKVPFRKYPSLIRVFAKEPNTKVFRDGKQVSFISDAGGVDGRGFQEMRMSPTTSGVKPYSVVISGDKPIGVMLYNCGVQEDGYPLPNSDPFTEVQTPLEQYQEEITFCTPATFGGLCFGENYLNIVYETDSTGGIPEDMMWAEVHGGKFEWSTLRTKFPGSSEMFRYDVQGKKFATKTLTLPTMGVWKMKANKPFAAYSFGYDWCDSYGYPTSAALADLEKPDTIPPVPPWIMQCNGNVYETIVTDMPNDDSVRSNLAKIIVHRDSSFNYDFTDFYNLFEAGVDRSTKWRLNIIDPEQDARAVITFSDRRGNDTTLDIRYYAIKLDILPHYWDYGKLQIGEVGVQDFKLVNLSATGTATINNIRFMKNSQHFEFLGLPPFPFKLGPSGELAFQVKFTGLEPGMFADSIGVEDSCLGLKYKSKVEARVGSPIINVTDADFGDVTIGMNAVREIVITNTGSTELIITGYSLPADPVYVPTDLPSMSATNPLVIKINGSYKYHVTFTPLLEKNYPDQMVFFNNAKTIDSIALLTGRGIKPSLVANGYDWKRRRIDRPGTFDVAAYPYDGPVGQETIHLFNGGSQDVEIYDMVVETDINGSAFEFDRLKLKNLTIPAKGDIIIPVKFHPTKVGVHELTFTYDNSAKSTTKTTLKGIGILPKIATNDADFGMTIVKDYNSPNPADQPIIFTNTPWSDTDGTDVSDSLIINLKIGPNGDEISRDGVNWGVQGFKYDATKIKHSNLGDNLTFPVVLHPNETIEIVGPLFVAPDAITVHTGTVSSVSDAFEDKTSTWTGRGLDQGLTATGGGTTICVWKQDTIICTVRNLKAGTINVTSLALDPPLPELTFLDPAQMNGFPLPENKSIDVPILFSPISTDDLGPNDFKNFHSTLVVFNNTLTNPKDTTAKIDCKAVHYDRKTSSTTTLTDVKIGDTFMYSILFDGGSDFTMANVKQLDCRIDFNTDFMGADIADIQIGSLLSNGWTLSNARITQLVKDSSVALSFTLNSNGAPLNGTGEIAKIPFKVFLPWYNISDTTKRVKDSTGTISHIVVVTSNDCINITSTDSKVKLMPTCVYDLRQIKISSEVYALQKINPNPVGSAGANINFTVALPGWTDISIYNSSGELVARPVSQELSNGEYTVNLPIELMSSGVYHLMMKSGPFSDTQNIVVTK